MAEERKTDNLTMRIWLELIENIAGPNALKSILNYAHLEKYIDTYPPDNDELEIPVEDVKNLYTALIELLGQKGARGLQLRAGREFIRVAGKKRPDISKALQIAAHFVPEIKKMQLVLKKFMEEHERRWASQLDRPRFELQEEGDYFLIIDRDNPMSEKLTSQTPVCSTFVGMLQELMERTTGHPHDVEEIECRAMGYPADVFRISKVRRE